eukprot:SAG31_NODE_15637_length_745_cov_1.157895_1_plen_57_part_01
MLSLCCGLALLLAQQVRAQADARYLWNADAEMTKEDLLPSVGLGEVVLLTAYYGQMP